MALNLPDDLGPLDTQDEEWQTNPHRNISHEHNINRQLDRIAYLRSTNQPWAESLYQLRDMIVGLEDTEFWTGIPTDIQQQLTDGNADTDEIQTRFAEQGWNTRSIRAYETPDGEVVLDPSPSDLSRDLRIITRLLARKGLLYKRRIKTRFGHPTEHQTTED